MTRIGIYPGSFDPVTNGHLDIIERAFALVDRLIVAIGVHHGKKPLFEAVARIEMLQNEVAPLAKAAGAAFDILTFEGLIVDFARQQRAALLVRGLRNGADFDYEMQMAGMNGAMAGDIQTVFLPASPARRHIEASLVRQIAAMGGDVTDFVPPRVAALLAAKFQN